MFEVPTMEGIKKTAANFSLPEHFVRRLCIDGTICCVKSGNKYLINQQRFVEYLNALPSPASAEPPSGTVRPINLREVR